MSETPIPDAAPAAVAPPPVDRPPARRWPPISPALVVAIVALLVALWQWSETRREAAQLQGDLARRIADMETGNRDVRLLADQVRNNVRDIESRMGLLEARVLETQNQRIALETLYQELARNRDEWVLAEVEQILITAGQQLQLSGNVRAALIALEAADKRLARADRPTLIPVRRLINRDIERLRALPSVDVPGLALKLDNLIAAADDLPMASEQRPAAAPARSSPSAGGFWDRLVDEYGRDLKDLLRIRVTESRQVPLVAPEQAYFVRENLKLKLLSARLALLARDGDGFRTELRTSAKWIEQYFDPSAKPVANAITTLRQLSDNELAIRLPDIAESLEAVRTLRVSRERALR
ncbi:MAG: uroporphyrinogen-III C-methyltransferase [Burkholderiales bacterium]|nr:uroporphyrinogen-III C-methyltransferase [Burkholderiales bacterium]